MKKYFFISFIFAIIFFMLIYFFILNNKIRWKISSGKPVTVLILGHNGKTTQSVVLGIFNPKTMRLGIVSLPANIRVPGSGVYSDELGNIYFSSGIAKLKKIMKNLIGIGIDFYAALSSNDFVRIIDIIGGIEVFSDKEIPQVVPRGRINLDGSKTLEYIINSEQDKLELQQELIMSIVKKMILELSILQKPKFVKDMLKFADTDLTAGDITALISAGNNVDFLNFDLMKIGGKTVEAQDTTFVELDPARVKSNIAEIINTLNIPRPELAPRSIKVQILNGSGIKGAAFIARSRLIKNGFNVMEFGNAESQDYEETVVFDRCGLGRKAFEVANALKCKNIYPKINRNLLVDVTVIIGRNN